MNPFSSIPQAIKEIKKGKGLIVVDSPKRENQGDLVFGGEKITAKKINFLLKNCRGLICAAITKKEAIKLKIPLMVSPRENREKTGVQFTVSVDAKNVNSFGISASDRAKTIKTLADPNSKPDDLVRPGHIFPLLARDGGVAVRRGHTEATTDLSRLAGLAPVGVLSEILDEKGEPARLPKLIRFSLKFKIKIITIEDLFFYLKKHPLPLVKTKSVYKSASSKLLTRYGPFCLAVYKSIIDDQEHIALYNKIKTKGATLCRIHSQCLTGETFSSLKCDCKKQLEKSLRILGKKSGIFIYLRQEGRGIGLTNKIKAYHLQEKGLDTVEAQKSLGLPIDARGYQEAAEILRDLGVSQINILTNNPDKIKQLEALGIKIAKRLPLEIRPFPESRSYLKAKKEKLGHLLKNV